MLDDLTQASINMVTLDRSAASAKLASVESQSEALLSAIQSPDIASMLGKRANTVQQAFARFEGRLTRAKLLVDEPAIAEATAFQSLQAAVAEGQRLRKAMLKVPSSDTVVTVRETATRRIALHQAGDVVCFHIDVQGGGGAGSCGPAEMSVDILDGDSSKTVVDATPSIEGPTDFCLTMGPDAGSVRVSVMMCGQSSSLLIYNSGTPIDNQAGHAPESPSNLAATMVTQTSVTLSWQDNSDNEAGFHIERAQAAKGPWKSAGTVGANVTSFTDSGLKAGGSYYYRVSAFN